MQTWYAVYVKANHEHVAYSELQKKQIASFLPSVRTLRQWKDRKKWIDFPLFPGYLFIHVNPEAQSFLNVLKTRGVISILSAVAGNPTPVPCEEIDSLKILLESGNPIDVYPHFREGTEVRVRRGPLQGAVGSIKMRHDDCIFVVTIELLGRSIGVKISADDIEAA